MVNILFILGIYIVVAFLLAYYVELFRNNDSVSKNDLKRVFSYYKALWDRYRTDGDQVYSLSIVGVSAVVGMIQIYIFDNLLLGSFLPIIIIYFLAPFVDGGAEGDSSDDNQGFLAHALSNLGEIMVGYGSGMVAIMIYEWAVLGVNGFLWLLVNLIIITFVVVMSIIKKKSKLDNNL